MSLDSFQRRRKPAYHHGGMSEYALEVVGAHIQAEYSAELVRPRYFKWVAPDITLQSCLSGKQHVDKRTTKARRSSDATTAPTVSLLDNKLEHFQSDCVNTRCHRPWHLVWDHIGQVPTAGMCFWCFQRSFGEPKPDWTPQGLAQRRKGVSYEPRRSISETKVITIPSLSRSLANLQGVVNLSEYTDEQCPPTPKSASLTSFNPHSPISHRITGRSPVFRASYGSRIIRISRSRSFSSSLLSCLLSAPPPMYVSYSRRTHSSSYFFKSSSGQTGQTRIHFTNKGYARVRRLRFICRGPYSHSLRRTATGTQGVSIHHPRSHLR